MTEIELYQRYVDPVYLPLMGTVILTQSNEEKEGFKHKFKQIVSESDDDLIKKLLRNSNWRFSLVGAWICFIKNKTEMSDEIGKMLLQGKSGTVGYCYALAKFKTNETAQYLIQYLEKELKRVNDETFQDTALYSLKYIDKIKGTNYADLILKKDGPWDNFVNHEHGIKGFKLSQGDRWSNIDKHFNKFVQMLDFIEDLAEDNGH